MHNYNGMHDRAPKCQAPEASALWALRIICYCFSFWQLYIVIMKQARLPIGPVTNLSIRLNSTLTDEATLLQLLLAGANC